MIKMVKTVKIPLPELQFPVSISLFIIISMCYSILHYYISADSRKKGHQGGAIIRAHCSIKKGHYVPSKKGTLFHQKRTLLNRVQVTCFEHFKTVRTFTSKVMT